MAVNMRTRRKKRKCCWCPRPADSGEHIWSDWMNRVFNIDRYRFRRMAPDGTTLQTYPKSQLDLKARVICTPCNGGWSSDLENDHAKPALTPLLESFEPITLTPEEVFSIAAFAFKTAVVADAMTDERKPFFARAERDAFRRRLEIPPGIQIWIAG